ncbi:glutathione transferase GstA [Serratia sp. AKBS12]|uniref:glutathione transferase GstA n=1 Tax=Serratia sp. AKBS12 TaxID=2974597 RepID=UPI0021667A62|nr:glutathione transferase GstA [Serratia sp. AKBS12]MCS3408534.1 glutathione transferase GstA [Serratia sp. AKBS12]
MKLYIAPGSCSLSPHIALREAGLAFTLVPVDTKTHTYDGGKDYYQINPLGYVPALELANGEVFREGVTLIQYIADLAPTSGLAPANGTIERYRLLEWLNFLTSEIHKGFVPIFHGASAGSYFAIAQRKLFNQFKWLDGQLAQREYLSSDRFSIADCYLFALTNWAKADWMVSVYGLELDLSSLDHLAAWHSRIMRRPTVQAAIKAEGLAL